MLLPDRSDALAVSGYWDDIVAGWTERGDDPLWREHSDNVNNALLARWLPQAHLANILKTDLFDEAVSKGIYPFLRNRAGTVLGIDASPKVADAAHTRHPRLRGLAADVLQLPFADESFDGIVSISTLDHFDSAEKIPAAMKELYRVLAPGGTLVITIDNGSNPVVAVRNHLPNSLLRRLGIIPYEMGVTCGARTFVKLLRSSGFHVQDVSFILHAPRYPPWLPPELSSASEGR